MCKRIILAPIPCARLKNSESDAKKIGALRIRSRVYRALVTKYLATQRDRNLTLKGHIKALCSKISREHARSFLLQDTWGNCGAMENNQLQKLQNRALRVLTNSSHDAEAMPLLYPPGLKAIQDFIDTETSTTGLKALMVLYQSN